MVESTYIFRNTWLEEMGSSITISLSEEKVPDSAIFEPVETQKKPWNLFTSWLLCRSAIVILSLITSNAFCHLLVTNLHLADYQRSPNQWVIGVEDCVDNPGNESTEKLTAGEESLPVTSVRSYTQRFSITLTEFLLVGRVRRRGDNGQWDELYQPL